MTLSAPEQPPRTETSLEHFDVLIVGAGVSGIGCAYHLQREQPGKGYAILEGREASGGTWDLFRYRRRARSVARAGRLRPDPV